MIQREDFDDDYGYYIHCGDEDDGIHPSVDDAEDEYGEEEEEWPR